MTVFADSSALVKLYADEPEHDVIRGLGAMAVSCLARVEVPGAIWRKHRRRELSAEQADVLMAAYEADYLGSDGRRDSSSSVSFPTSDAAARLAVTHRLRTYGAVQLASARAVRDRADV